MREKLFEKLKEKYKDFLYGKCSFASVYKVEKQLHSVVAEESKDIEEVGIRIKEVLKQIEEVEFELEEEYNKEIGDPLVKELTEFLNFSGLVKGPAYYKRALKLKEKLEKNDKNLKIRKRVAYEFLINKRGINSSEAVKIADLLLELGALYIGDLWMYEDKDDLLIKNE